MILSKNKVYMHQVINCYDPRHKLELKAEYILILNYIIACAYNHWVAREKDLKNFDTVIDFFI